MHWQQSYWKSIFIETTNCLIISLNQKNSIITWAVASGFWYEFPYLWATVSGFWKRISYKVIKVSQALTKICNQALAFWCVKHEDTPSAVFQYNHLHLHLLLIGLSKIIKTLAQAFQTDLPDIFFPSTQLYRHIRNQQLDPRTQLHYHMD